MERRISELDDATLLYLAMTIHRDLQDDGERADEETWRMSRTLFTHVFRRFVPDDVLALAFRYVEGSAEPPEFENASAEGLNLR
jgi:hypothetical protein